MSMLVTNRKIQWHKHDENGNLLDPKIGDIVDGMKIVDIDTIFIQFENQPNLWAFTGGQIINRKLFNWIFFETTFH